MLQEVRKTLLEGFKILLACLCLRNAAVVLERAGCRNQDYAGRLETCHTALDVEELLSAEVGTEACLCDRVVRELESDSGGCD